MNKTLTIIIPAFNESKRIKKTLNEIDEYISSNSFSHLYQVVVVDDGGLDNIKELVNSWIEKECKNKSVFKVLSYLPNHGKGYAVKEGFLNATSDLILYTDADGASPIKEVEKLLHWIDNGYDVACGSRILQDKSSQVEMSFKRRIIGFVFHLILVLLRLASLRDTQCGFKLFQRDVAKKLAESQKCFNYSFDIEYLFLSRKLGYKIKEVPINWYHVHGSKVSILKDSIAMLIEVLKIRFCYKYNFK